MPEKTSPQSHVTLPFALDTPAFTQAWNDYLEYRRQRRLPKLVAISIQKLWDKLSDYGPEVAVEALNQAVMSGWQGVFPERVQRELGVGRPQSRTAAASLGALQMQLKQVETELNEIYYPGGAQWKVDPTPEKKARAQTLMEQRKQLRMKIESSISS